MFHTKNIFPIYCTEFSLFVDVSGFRSLCVVDRMDIKVTPLGAGQDVGRSCLLLTIGHTPPPPSPLGNTVYIFVLMFPGQDLLCESL